MAVQCFTLAAPDLHGMHTSTPPAMWTVFNLQLHSRKLSSMQHDCTVTFVLGQFRVKLWHCEVQFPGPSGSSTRQGYMDSLPMPESCTLNRPEIVEKNADHWPPQSSHTCLQLAPQWGLPCDWGPLPRDHQLGSSQMTGSPMPSILELSCTWRIHAASVGSIHSQTQTFRSPVKGPQISLMALVHY